MAYFTWSGLWLIFYYICLELAAWTREKYHTRYIQIYIILPWYPYIKLIILYSHGALHEWWIKWNSISKCQSAFHWIRIDHVIKIEFDVEQDKNTQYIFKISYYFFRIMYNVQQHEHSSFLVHDDMCLIKCFSHFYYTAWLFRLWCNSNSFCCRHIKLLIIRQITQRSVSKGVIKTTYIILYL